MASNWASAIEIIVFFVIAIGFGLHQLWRLRQLNKADATMATKADDGKSTPPSPNL